MSKLRNSAQGRACQVRLPFICNRNNETTVLAHLGGGGMGMKRNDLHGAFCCSSCHDIVDGRRTGGIDRHDVVIAFYEAIIRTQEIWLKEGLIKHG